ncbi:MAG: hypothetical protein VKO64_13075 [Candidatus Sericytochromatia bacterium]|nr:hypothetical protein [Candidatus Sericytochromatia bacterium]
MSPFKLSRCVGVATLLLLSQSGCAVPTHRPAVLPAAKMDHAAVAPLQVRIPMSVGGAGRLRIWTRDGESILDQVVTLPETGGKLQVEDLAGTGDLVLDWEQLSGSPRRPWGGFATLISGETASVELDERSTAAAAIWRAFWNGSGIPATQTVAKVREAISDLLARVPGSHPRLLDVSGIATDLLAGRKPEEARAPVSGSVVFGFRGWPEGARASLRADDLTSVGIDNLDAGTQDGRSVRWTGLSPGRRILELTMEMGVAGIVVATTAVDVAAGGEATASWPLAAWESGPDLPAPRGHAAAIAAAGGLWVMGGRSLSDAGSVQTNDTCWCLDTGSAEATWSRGPDLPFRSGNPMAVVKENRIWLLDQAGYLASLGLSDGACKADAAWTLESGQLEAGSHRPLLLVDGASGLMALVADSFPAFGSLSGYWLRERDPLPWQWLVREASGSWTASTASVVPTSRETDTSLLADGRDVFVAGGHSLVVEQEYERTAPAARLGDVERIDSEGNVRQVLPSLPVPISMAAMARSPRGLVLSGGERAPFVTSASTWILENRQSGWTPLPPLATPRERHVMATMGRYVYAIGGTRRTGAFNTLPPADNDPDVQLSSVERLDLDALAARGRSFPTQSAATRGARR